MRDESFPNPPASILNYISLLVPFSLATLFSFTLHVIKKARKIELEKAQADLQNLRYQLQPHFLFNSLNNIYSVSIISPDKTPNYILDMSNILRYLLKTEKEDFVDLNEDIKFCQQFVSLQQLRFGKSSEVWELEWPEKSRMEGYKIPPFLIIPLIENVFKYGVNPDENSPVSIKISINDDELLLETNNFLVKLNNETLLSNHKLGLKKTQSLLQLLYPSKHQIDIKTTNNQFSLVLKIKLK